MSQLPPQHLSVIIPVFNEEKTIREVVERVLVVPGLLEIIIVDDCSVDETAAIVASLAKRYPQIKSIRLDRNAGKTAALKEGFAQSKGDIVIVQDADLEYDPEEISCVTAPILSGEAEVVYGSRFLVRRAARVVYFYHYLGNKALTFFSNVCTNLNMTDVETCYKAFRGEIIRNMVITSNGFGFEIEVTAKVAKLKCRIFEVPISYYGRTYEEGKKIKPIDGVAALWYVIRYNVFSSLSSAYSSVPKLAPIGKRAERKLTISAGQ